MVAQHVGYSEVARHWFGMNGQRRGAQYHGVALLLMCSYALAHLWIDHRGIVLVEDSFADGFELGQRVAAQVSGGAHHQTLEFHAAQLVPEGGLQNSENLTDTRLTTAHPITGVSRRGESGHQGAVQVEEGSHLRPSGAQRYIGDRVGCRTHRHVGQSTVVRHAYPP